MRTLLEEYKLKDKFVVQEECKIDINSDPYSNDVLSRSYEPFD